MIQTDDGPLPALLILRATVEPWRLLVRDVLHVGSQKFKKKLEANCLNGSRTLSLSRNA